MARPTDYTPELVEKAKAYVAQYERGQDLTQAHHLLPSVADLAIELDVSRSTVYEWAKTHDEFSDILEKLLAYQESFLANLGLSGKWNPTITKLMLSKHGYRESSDITTDGKALPTPILGAATKDGSADA